MNGTSNVRPLKVTSSDASSKTSAERAEHRALARRAAQEELADAKPVVLEPAAAGEKRERAGAAAEARGLDVEEHDAARTSRRAPPARAIEQRRAARRRRADSDSTRRRPCESIGVPDAIDRTTRAGLVHERAAERLARRASCGAPRFDVRHVGQLAHGVGPTRRSARPAGRSRAAARPDRACSSRRRLAGASAAAAAATRRPWRAARSRLPGRRTTGSPTRTGSRRSARACARAARRACANSGSLKPMPPG